VSTDSEQFSPVLFPSVPLQNHTESTYLLQGRTYANPASKGRRVRGKPNQKEAIFKEFRGFSFVDVLIGVLVDLTLGQLWIHSIDPRCFTDRVGEE
jgi:hypothetical protein